jgi:hypothetical protein
MVFYMDLPCYLPASLNNVMITNEEYTIAETVYREYMCIYNVIQLWGTRWRSWLRHCATSLKDAGFTPDFIGFLNRRNPSSRTGVDSASNRNEYQESSWG